MTCETCGHTMGRVVDHVFQCPRCGTLTVQWAGNSRPDTYVPKLVERCRRFEADGLGLHCPAARADQWRRLGIAEAIRPTEDPMSDTQTPTPRRPGERWLEDAGMGLFDVFEADASGQRCRVAVYQSRADGLLLCHGPALAEVIGSMFPPDCWQKFNTDDLAARVTVELLCTREELIELRAALADLKGTEAG